MKLSTQQHRRLVANLTGTADQTARNAANQQTGADFEKRLDGYHAELMTTGQAMIMRTNPKIRMTGPGRAAIVGKGELGRHLAELHERHAVGIAHILATGWQPTPTARPQHAAQPVVVAEVPPAIDAPDLAIWLRGVQGAIKLDDRKQSILAKRRRQPAR
jgi:hypothetical protein